MNKKITALALSFSMCILAGCSGSDESASAPQTTGVNVSVYTASSGNIESTVSYSATLVASESVSVVSKVGAQAMSVPVDEGDYVSAGDVLLNLDPTDIKLSYNQALAAYESAVAGYNTVVNSSTVQQTAQAQQALSSARIAYDQAKLNYDREKILYENASQLKLAEQNYNDAKANYDRIKQLYNMGGVSQIELDSANMAMISAEENYKTAVATASAAYDAAKAALTNAENALKTATENVELTKRAVESSIQNATASVNSAKAALGIAANSLNNTTITAPISGYVSMCNATAGQMVSPGTPVFEIKNTNLIDAQIQVTEAVIPMIDIGTKALISVDSAGIKNLEGTVTLVNPIKDEMSGLYTVKVSIDNFEETIMAGMIADITLTTASREDVIKIPSEALINESGSYYVYIAKDNLAIKQEVTVGITDLHSTEIISGIKESDLVIVEGKEYLSEENNEICITGEFKVQQ